MNAPLLPHDNGYVWPIRRANEPFTEDAVLCGAMLVGAQMCIYRLADDLRCPRHGQRKARRTTPASAPLPAVPDGEDESPMLSGWDLQESRAEGVLRRAHAEFRVSDEAAALFDWQVDALRRAGLLTPPLEVETYLRRRVGELQEALDATANALVRATETAPDGEDAEGDEWFRDVAAVMDQAVPDAENADATVSCDDMSGPNGVGGPCVLPPGHPHIDGIGGQWETDGEDVPARLDAAAEALAQTSGWQYPINEVRRVAGVLRNVSPTARAAIAAALARPSEREL